MQELLILNYHQILPKSAAGLSDPAALFAVYEEMFQAQMDLIEKHQVSLLSIEDVVNKKPFEGQAVALTFDDGYLSDFETVMPYLQKKGFPASFFPIVNQVGKKGFMTWEEIKTLSDNGFTIGTHGLSHQNLVNLSEAEKHTEIEKARRITEQYLDQRITLFSFPFGRYDKTCLSIAKSIGFKAVMGTQKKLNTDPNAFVLHRWNIKRNTSLEAFEKIISFDRNTLNKEIRLSKIKKYATYVLGPSLSNQVNLLLAHITQPK